MQITPNHPIGETQVSGFLASFNYWFMKIWSKLGNDFRSVLFVYSSLIKRSSIEANFLSLSIVHILLKAKKGFNL